MPAAVNLIGRTTVGSMEDDLVGEGGADGASDADERDDDNDAVTDMPADHEDADVPDRFTRLRRSTAGVMMTGIALGLQDALQLPRTDPPFVIKASSDPDGPQGPIDLHFDPDDPTKTVAVIRERPTER